MAAPASGVKAKNFLMRSHAQRERGKKGLKEEMEESKIAQLSPSFLSTALLRLAGQIAAAAANGGICVRACHNKMKKK